MVKQCKNNSQLFGLQHRGDGSDPLCDKKPTGGRCYRHGGTALLFHRIFAKVGANAGNTGSCFIMETVSP